MTNIPWNMKKICQKVKSIPQKVGNISLGCVHGSSKDFLLVHKVANEWRWKQEQEPVPWQKQDYWNKRSCQNLPNDPLHIKQMKTTKAAMAYLPSNPLILCSCFILLSAHMVQYWCVIVLFWHTQRYCILAHWSIARVIQFPGYNLYLRYIILNMLETQYAEDWGENFDIMPYNNSTLLRSICIYLTHQAKSKGILKQ